MNKNKLSDAELQAILESDDFFDDEVLEQSASDIEETDFVIENEEIDDIISVEETQSFTMEDADTPNYIARDGTTWAKLPFTSRVKRAKCNIQKVKSGLTQYSPSFTSKREAFYLFFDRQIMDTILAETNRKAQHYYGHKIGVKLPPFTREELEGFIGLLFIFGALHSAKEPITMLWSTNPIFCRPIVSAIRYVSNTIQTNHVFHSF